VTSMTLKQVLTKIRSLYDWYSKGGHGSSERFNDGRLSVLTELERFADIPCSGCGYSLTTCMNLEPPALACCPDCAHYDDGKGAHTTSDSSKA